MRSGGVTDEYSGKYQFEAGPGLLGELAAGMVPLVPDETEVLAGLVFQLTAAQQALFDHRPQPASSPREVSAALNLGPGREEDDPAALQ